MTAKKCYHYRKMNNDITGWCHLFARDTKCKGNPEKCIYNVHTKVK